MTEQDLLEIGFYEIQPNVFKNKDDFKIRIRWNYQDLGDYITARNEKGQQLFEGFVRKEQLLSIVSSVKLKARLKKEQEEVLNMVREYIEFGTPLRVIRLKEWLKNEI